MKVIIIIKQIVSGVMSYLSKFWSKLKHKPLNYKTLFKIFVGLIGLYCVVSVYFTISIPIYGFDVNIGESSLYTTKVNKIFTTTTTITTVTTENKVLIEDEVPAPVSLFEKAPLRETLFTGNLNTDIDISQTIDFEIEVVNISNNLNGIIEDVQTTAKANSKEPVGFINNFIKVQSPSYENLIPITNELTNSLEPVELTNSILKVQIPDNKNPNAITNATATVSELVNIIKSKSEAGIETIPSGLKFLNKTTSETTFVTPEFPWTWECIKNRTTTENVDEYCARLHHSSSNLPFRVTQDVCWLTCGTRRSLWPYPSEKFYLGKNIMAFYPKDMILTEYKVRGNDPETQQLLQEAYALAFQSVVNTFLKKVKNKMNHQEQQKSAIQIQVRLRVLKNERKISLITDESYSLEIYKSNKGLTIAISGKSFFGVRHGLETMTQLIAFDSINDCFQILSEVKIKDKPVYPYRGLMVDTARNFIPIPALKRVIDGMAYNKLNMFHLHLTDTNSFPFYSKRVPQMTQYGAYSENEIYRPKEIQDLVKYARLRGVKIIPELDAPSHAGNGWQWGPEAGLKDLALCVNAEPWRDYCGQPPCGQLNPVNPNVYDILEQIYQDMLEVFDNDIFHMGGDEVYIQCWATQAIENWMQINNSTRQTSVWEYFQSEALRRLRHSSSEKSIIPILWNSKLTADSTEFNILDPNDYIIQIWDANKVTISDLLNGGFPLIFSNIDTLYLDWGSGSWLGSEHNYAYINWQGIYDFNKQFMDYPFNNISIVRNRYHGSLPQVLGGEGTLWSEKVDEDNLEIKLWPRECALAESLWSDPMNRSDNVYDRLLIQSQRMRDRGLRVDRRQPKSCDQINGHCDDPIWKL